MNKSYRNTVEIASYANQLAGITDMDLFDRHGDPVDPVPDLWSDLYPCLRSRRLHRCPDVSSLQHRTSHKALH